MTEIAILGGGCFWCLEPAFTQLKGVLAVESGYANGEGSTSPTYEEVCQGKRGFAEVVKITFDPEVISFNDLLEVFFTLHDPATLNQQGADIGVQYRSAILTHNAQQQEQAKAMIQTLEELKAYSDPIVTQVEPLKNYFIAEDEHQSYFEKHPYQGYCQVVIAPKLDKMRRKHIDLLRKQ